MSVTYKLYKQLELNRILHLDYAQIKTYYVEFYGYIVILCILSYNIFKLNCAQKVD